MGLVREPKGVDFVVGHSTLTEKERLMISEIIAHYKRTGKVPSNYQRPKPRTYKNTRVKKKKLENNLSLKFPLQAYFTRKVKPI